jgi:hypothetical protein
MARRFRDAMNGNEFDGSSSRMLKAGRGDAPPVAVVGLVCIAALTEQRSTGLSAPKAQRCSKKNIYK